MFTALQGRRFGGPDRHVETLGFLHAHPIYNPQSDCSLLRPWRTRRFVGCWWYCHLSFQKELYGCAVLTQWRRGLRTLQMRMQSTHFKHVLDSHEPPRIQHTAWTTGRRTLPCFFFQALSVAPPHLLRLCACLSLSLSVSLSTKCQPTAC